VSGSRAASHALQALFSLWGVAAAASHVPVGPISLIRTLQRVWLVVQGHIRVGLVGLRVALAQQGPTLGSLVPLLAFYAQKAHFRATRALSCAQSAHLARFKTEQEDLVAVCAHRASSNRCKACLGVWTVVVACIRTLGAAQHARIAPLVRILKDTGHLLHPAVRYALKDSIHPPQEPLAASFAVPGPSWQPWLRQDATTATQALTRLALEPLIAPPVGQGHSARLWGLPRTTPASSAGLELMALAWGPQAPSSVNPVHLGDFQPRLGQLHPVRVWTALLEPSHPTMVRTALYAPMEHSALVDLTRP
jgi:hypothetical protein